MTMFFLSEKWDTHKDCLVVWNMNFIFPFIGNVIIPTDELIFFRGGRYTTNQKNNFNSENDENPLIHWKWGYFQTDPNLAAS